jgi:hypothetical protein
MEQRRAFNPSICLLGAAGICAVISCATTGLSLSQNLREAARMEAGAGIRAQAWLLAPGSMRINIERDPPSEKSCGLTLFMRENEPGRAVLEVRCGGVQEQPGSGVFDTVLGLGGPAVNAYNCSLSKPFLDFTPGEKTKNSGCFSATAKDGRVFDGCFNTVGLKPSEEPRGIRQ